MKAWAIMVAVFAALVLLVTGLMTREAYHPLRINDRRDGEFRRHLVFTSAGDRSNVAGWTAQDPNRNWDLAVAYYGDRGEHELFPDADYYFARKDGKFPNARWIHVNTDLFHGYRTVAVLDDDLQFPPGGISKMFQEGLMSGSVIFGPSQSPEGKISWPISQTDDTARWRYVNFIEMNSPCFTGDFLRGFLADFDPALKGWGTDWMYMNALWDREGVLDGKAALLDQVEVLNPHDDIRGRREIDTLQKTKDRIRVFNRMAEEKGIEKWPVRELSRRSHGYDI